LTDGDLGCIKARPLRGRATPNNLYGADMYNKQEQLQILQSIKLSDGESKTIDCPFCHGKKKFSISHKDGVLLWNCYKAQCNAKGAWKKGYSLSGLKNKISNTLVVAKNKNRGMPKILSNPQYHPHLIKYLEDNNCLPALNQGLVSIKYDPVDNRCLFMMNHDEGAVGRSLGGRNPKWLSYGDVSGILQVGNSQTAVVVEDAPSACSVASTGMYTGVAILGTSITQQQKRALTKFNRLIICLDNDAKNKAMMLLSQLRGLVSTSVRFISNDLKNETTTRIAKILEE